MQSVLTLGRQPSLGLAELESLFGAASVTKLGTQAAQLDRDSAEVNFSRLGGSTRLCKYLTEFDTADWHKIADQLARALPEYLAAIPDGKIRLGISYIGKGVSPRTINATGLTLKKIVKAEGRSVRVVPNSSTELNTAQIIHNQLTGPTGIEFVLIPVNSKRTVLAQTVATQDIAAYAARDQQRPKRDARVGMLPPKLAQIIVNLASADTNPASGSTVLDPFCGTGVVLQEASLIGFDIYGSDLEPRMVEYTDVNLQWLLTLPQNRIILHSNDNRYYKLETGDATKHHWAPMPNIVACETYLGRPLSSLPTPDTLDKIIADCDTIHRKFLENLATQTTKGSFRACIAVPAWKTRSGFRHLATLDHLEKLGYNRLRFVHVSDSDLIYHRPDQLVARELVILERT